MPPAANVTRYQADLSNPDNATAETIQVMCGQINKSAEDPVLRASARDAIARFRGGPLYVAAGVDPFHDAGAIASSAWWWAKHALRFVHHDGLIQVWFNERDQLQLLISPDLLLRMSDPRGDCAIYTMLVCAMLRACGVPYELVTAAVDPHQPDIFGHVYARAVLPYGRRLALDTSHGKYPGWEVPREHVIRKQIWDQDGNPIQDQARFSGLHAYQAYPNKPILPKRLAMVPGITLTGLGRLRGMGRYRGFGQDDSTTVLTPGIDTSNIPIANPPGGYPVATPAPSPGFNWGATIGNLLNQWTGIASNVIAPRNTIQTGPQGTSINVAAGSQLPTGALLTPSLAGGAGTIVWVVGGGIVLLLLVQLLGGKRH
jgi:hypothetical protein